MLAWGRRARQMRLPPATEAGGRHKARYGHIGGPVSQAIPIDSITRSFSYSQAKSTRERKPNTIGRTSRTRIRRMSRLDTANGVLDWTTPRGAETHFEGTGSEERLVRFLR